MNSKSFIYLALLLVFISCAGYLFYRHYSVETTMAPINSGTQSDSGNISVSTDHKARVESDNGSIPPKIIKAKLTVEGTDKGDVLRVTPTAIGREGSIVTFTYNWVMNGQSAGNADFVSGVKRGDKLIVKITPFDGKLYGDPKTITTEVTNTAPRITGIKEVGSSPNSLTYQVTASDPDGDIISYSLIDAPYGMTIDQNGLIRWAFGKEDYGKTIQAKVKVTDGHGGETTGDINFQLATK